MTIKEILKKFLPPPVNSFNREVNRIIALIEDSSNNINESILMNAYELDKIRNAIDIMKNEMNILKNELNSIKEGLGNVKEGLGNVKEGLGNVKEGLGNVKKGLGNVKEEIGSVKEDYIERLNKLASYNEKALRSFEVLENSSNELQSKMKKELEEYQKITKTSEEILWAEIFKDTIESSNWLNNKSFSPGRWAVGYPYLYVLYRILNSFRPKRILELGLGQSTKMISQYADFYDDVEHTVVEHDAKWVDYFSQEFSLPSKSQVIQLPLTESSYKDDNKITSYEKFEAIFKEQTFDYISIDGPFGANAEVYARIDVVRLLPYCLASSFVITVDDYERKGEKNMVEEIKAILNEAHTLYYTKVYWGKKQLCLICSEDLRFLTSL